MYYEILAKELVKDALREAEKRRLIKHAENSNKGENHPNRTYLLCKFGMSSACQPQLSV